MAVGPGIGAEEVMETVEWTGPDAEGGAMSEISSITMASVEEWQEQVGRDLGARPRLFQPPRPIYRI